MKTEIVSVCEKFASGDGESIRPFLSEDVEWTIAGDQIFHGKTAVIKFCDKMVEMGFPDFENSRTIIGDDCIVVEGNQVGTARHAKDGVKYCDVFRVDNDLVIEIVSYCVS